MYYVYVLLSQKDQELYIGSAPDLKNRFAKHVNGFVPSTKNRRPLKLVYYEAYINASDARKREVYLKGGKGHKELKIQLEQTFKKINYRHKY